MAATAYYPGRGGLAPCPRCGSTGPCACLLAGPPAGLRYPEKKLKGEVIGFRAWVVTSQAADSDEPILHSAGAGEADWLPGVNEAVCKAGSGSPYADVRHPLPAPAAGCGCGLYAYHEADTALAVVLRQAPAHGPFVAGAIKAWGRLEVHFDGFRAQYAQVVALAIPEYVRLLMPAQAQAAAEAAERHGASLVAMEELEHAAREFGDPVPMDARPSRKAGDDERLVLRRFGAGGFAGGSTGPVPTPRPWQGFPSPAGAPVAPRWPPAGEPSRDEELVRFHRFWFWVCAALANVTFGVARFGWWNLAAGAVAGYQAARSWVLWRREARRAP